MPLKSLKDKISNIAGEEVLGSAPTAADKGKPSKPEKAAAPRRKETKLTKIVSPDKKEVKEKPVKDKKERQPKGAFKDLFKQKEKEVEQEEKGPKQETVVKEKSDKGIGEMKDIIEGYEDVLLFLGVKEIIEPEVDFNSTQLDYIEFSQTQPVGFDFDEVTDFISRTKYTLHKLESALEQRNRDVVKVASEVKRVEEKMIAANQAKELERMIGGKTQEEIMLEENMELKIQINQLRKQMQLGNSEEINRLNRKIEVLESENQMLQSLSIPKSHKEPVPAGLPHIPKPAFGKTKKAPEPTKQAQKSNLPLPSFSDFGENKEDDFESMLNEIGGLYTDEG